MKKTVKPIRVAHIIGKLSCGGVESMIYNYYKNIDHSKYQFDFFVDMDSTCEFPPELLDMGARCYKIPPYNYVFDYIKTLVRYFRKNKYKIVHSHMNTMSVFSLFAAWVAGVPVRICHNHSTAGKGETKKNIMKYILRPFAKVFPTNLCACSEYAGKWIYGKNTDFKVFNNAINLSDFIYNPAVRKQLREELDLKDKFVVGHIGRFCYQKNQEFLIDIFYYICRIHKNSVLILIGEGETEKAVRQKAAQLGLDEKVMFLGKKSDVYRYYQAMDLFLLPSRYEGLGMVAVEAQAAGLPVIVSGNVPHEVDITSSVRHLSLNQLPEKWAKTALKFRPERKNTTKEIKNAGYCIETEAGKLADFYDTLIKKG